ncbi:MAG: hypothetical protein KJ697_04730 [Nanoarchaeota archaeon]|nr:hypothetical protein [Nanoarchaeota archaeon]MBU4124377.1 hypothetical protein [Nanoarchaeota archaeon]
MHYDLARARVKRDNAPKKSNGETGENLHYMHILAKKLDDMRPKLSSSGHDVSWIENLCEKYNIALT